MNRRRFLVGIAAGMPLLAGCSTQSGMSQDDTETPNNTDTETQTTTEQTVTEHVSTTQTSTPMPTPTQTSTPIPTPTQMPTATTPAPDIEGFGSAKLKTYTNKKYSYSIKRPVGWEADKSEPDSIGFLSSYGFILVNSSKSNNITKGKPLTQLSESFLQLLGRGELGPIKVKDRTEIQLPNNHNGLITNIDANSSDSIYSGKLLYTRVNGFLYSILILAPSDFYGPSVEQGMMKVLTSFTISRV